MIRQYLSARDITSHLVHLLKERGIDLTTTAEREIVRDIKEKLALCTWNAETEIVAKESYELPDGQVIQVGEERTLCVEPMFRPALLGDTSMVILPCFGQ